MRHYCYKYVNKDSEIVYIGKTDKKLSIRLSRHGKAGDNLPESSWDEINSCDIYYIKLPTAIMADVVESELIRRYMPKYNKAKKTKWEGIPFEEPEWIAYKQNGIIVSELFSKDKKTYPCNFASDNNAKIKPIHARDKAEKTYINRSEYLKFYNEFLQNETERNIAKLSIKAYSLGLRKLYEYLVQNEICEINSDTIEKWILFMKRSDLSANTITQYWDVVYRFFEWAEQNGIIIESPLERNARPLYVPKIKKTLSYDEIGKLLDSSNIPKTGNTKNNIRNYTIVSLILLTGLRSDELRELRLSNLNFEKEIVSFKTSQNERIIPFSQPAQRIVLSYLTAGIRPEQANNDDFLFGTHTNKCHYEIIENQIIWNKLDASTLGRLVHKYCKDVLGRNVTPQNLRDCSAILIQYTEADTDLTDIQKMLGHKNLVSTRRMFKRLDQLDKKI